MHRLLWRSKGGGRFLMSEVPLYSTFLSCLSSEGRAGNSPTPKLLY